MFGVSLVWWSVVDIKQSSVGVSWLHGLHGSCNLLVQQEILTEVLDSTSLYLLVLISTCQASFIGKRKEPSTELASRILVQDVQLRLCTFAFLKSQRRCGLRFYRFYVMCSSACEHRYSTHRLADAVCACASGQKPVLDLTRSLTGSAKLGF